MNIDIPMILPWGHSTMFIGYVHNTRLSAITHSFSNLDIISSFINPLKRRMGRVSYSTR